MPIMTNPAQASRQASLMPLCDAHTHPGEDAEWLERLENGILSLICASTPPEAEALFTRLKRISKACPENNGNSLSSCLIPTAGLHPWHADTYSVSDMERWLCSCPVIGEIGMDSVWCSVPLSVQERVFREQLALAVKLCRPVILHTKGQEARIARILREYPNTYLIHWYSCEESLEDYIRLGCYISIGPDVWWNPAVQHAAKAVPADRILIETDGMAAVSWAFCEAPDQKRRPLPGSVSGALDAVLLETAALRHISAQAARALFFRNLTEGFLQSMNAAHQ
jgi:TatD DNase family protein